MEKILKTSESAVRAKISRPRYFLVFPNEVFIETNYGYIPKNSLCARGPREPPQLSGKTNYFRHHFTHIKRRRYCVHQNVPPPILNTAAFSQTSWI